MSDRAAEHDGLIVDMNLALQGIAPTEERLAAIEAVDPTLYQRLRKGETWITGRLEQYAAGEIDSLGDVRIAWAQWLALYHEGLKRAGQKMER
jgi:hypothetical protein